VAVGGFQHDFVDSPIAHPARWPISSHQLPTFQSGNNSRLVKSISDAVLHSLLPSAVTQTALCASVVSFGKASITLLNRNNHLQVCATLKIECIEVKLMAQYAISEKMQVRLSSA
jgi:hypothetical protein